MSQQHSHVYVTFMYFEICLVNFTYLIGNFDLFSRTSESGLFLLVVLNLSFLLILALNNNYHDDNYTKSQLYFCIGNPKKFVSDLPSSESLLYIVNSGQYDPINVFWPKCVGQALSKII